MTNKKSTTVLIGLSVATMISNALATDLTLYNGFAEVRDPVTLNGNRFDWTPPADLSQYLVAGSLELEYPGIISRTLLPATPSMLTAFEGREVLVRRPGLDAPIKAKVVRADMALFEANAQFFTADPNTVIYPSLEGVRFAPSYFWRFAGTGGAANLTYLTRAVSWTPRYTLNINADKSELESWADIRNASNLAYTAPNLTLLAGQVNLLSAGNDNNLRVTNAPIASFAKLADSEVSNVQVQASGESAGLQTFKYPSSVTLPARASTTIPFLQTRLTVERVLEHVAGFDQSPRQILPLNRLYILKAESDLPAGLMTVREDGHVVGQDNIDNSPKAEGATLNLGSDFDLRLIRTVKALDRTKNTARFKVAFSLTNTKTRSVTVRLHEILGQSWTLEQSVMPAIKRDTEGVSSEAKLAPGARLEATYTVLFKYQ